MITKTRWRHFWTGVGSTVQLLPDVVSPLSKRPDPLPSEGVDEAALRRDMERICADFAKALEKVTAR